MYLLGHADPKLTMRVYQQVLDMDGRAVEKLEKILGCSVEEAFTTLSGRAVPAPNKDPGSDADRGSRLPRPSEGAGPCLALIHRFAVVFCPGCGVK